MSDIPLDQTPLSLDEALKELSYLRFKDPNYEVSEFALGFITFVKLVYGGKPENKSPLAHAELIDTFDMVPGEDEEDASLGCCHRGFSKSTLVMLLFFYIAVFEGLPNFGKVNYILYVSDTIENGVKTMKQNIDNLLDTSVYLQSLLDVKKCKINAEEWEFCNKNGHKLTVRGFGAATGVRGTRKYGVRPQIAVFDDLLTDKNVGSDAIISKIEAMIYDAVRPALHPTQRKMIWIGTPFDKKDPLYKAIGSGAWKVSLFPICENYPCAKEDFIGVWEDRFSYKFVKGEYEFALKNGKINSFNKEYMLRIISDEDRLVKDSQLLWYDRQALLGQKDNYNYYITTDFATSEKQHADYTVISVWAYSEDRKWFWVDGTVARQDFGKTLDDLFNFVALYNPMSVGVEISGQQQGFLSIIQKEMNTRNIFFGLASDKKSGEVGIRPNKSKLERFNMVLPLFQQHRIYFPQELKLTKEIVQAMDELKHVSMDGFKSAHDDFCDTISQLQFMNEFTPSERQQVENENKWAQEICKVWGNSFDNDILEVYSDDTNYSSYTV